MAKKISIQISRFLSFLEINIQVPTKSRQLILERLYVGPSHDVVDEYWQP